MQEELNYKCPEIEAKKLIIEEETKSKEGYDAANLKVYFAV